MSTGRMSALSESAVPCLGIAVDVGDLGAGTVPADVLDLVLAAEKQGAESLWLGESYAVGSTAFHLPNPLLPLVTIAAHSSLRLGTGVLLLNAWPAMQLAHHAAVADQLTGGRLTLGVAAGNGSLATQLQGCPPLTAADLDAYLEQLRQLWSASGTDAIAPPPYRTGGPELLIGGWRPAAARRAAQLGDGWYASSTYGLALVAAQSAAYRAALPAGRHGQVAVNRFTLVRSDEDEARHLATRYLLPVIERYTANGSVRLGSGIHPPRDTRVILDELALVGSPATVRQRMHDYARVGVTAIQLRVRTLGMPWATARETLDELSRAHLIHHPDADDRVGTQVSDGVRRSMPVAMPSRPSPSQRSSL